ncbi:MAG: glucose-1-phosphate adenylyltransferase subunit GlgD [Gracilibacteraceae bacterium]|jgi:glucose-1-phosphate adenylyltransferase|nr:glucose-1-phosphate adenylyltransferase subunit GlgD [Gracilibacteraceae bacterium]
MPQAMGLITTNQIINLGKLTADRPVAAVPFAARYRLLDFALSNLVNSDVRTVGVITPYHYRSIMDHLGAGREWFLDRKVGGLFILPGSNYGMKSMNAKFLLKDLLKNVAYLKHGRERDVIVSSANQVFTLNYRGALEAHEENESDLTMFYREEERALRGRRDNSFFIRLGEGDRVQALVPAAALTAREARRLFLDTFIIRRQLLLDILEWYKTMEYSDLQDIIAENANSWQMRAVPFRGYLKRVETIEDYFSGSMDFLRADVRRELFGKENRIHTKVKDNMPAYYGVHSSVTNSLVASGCRIEGTVENSILFRKVNVAKGAIVRGSVIMQGCVIDRDCLVEHVVCDKFARVERGALLKGRLSAPSIVGKECVV